MRKYEKAAAAGILRNRLDSLLEIRDDGVWLTEACRDYGGAAGLWWNFPCDLDDPDGPDPETVPALPIPFTALELAAFAVGGIGFAIVPEEYGWFDEGPDRAALDALGGDMAKKPKQALKEAYAAIRAAQLRVGTLDRSLEREVVRLQELAAFQLREAESREGVHEGGIPQADYWARVDRAKATLAEINAQIKAAEEREHKSRIAWRKTMVTALLDPWMTVPEEGKEKYHRWLIAVCRDEAILRGYLSTAEDRPVSDASRKALGAAVRRDIWLSSQVGDEVHRAVFNHCVVEKDAINGNTPFHLDPAIEARWKIEIELANQEIDAEMKIKPLMSKPIVARPAETPETREGKSDYWLSCDRWTVTECRFLLGGKWPFDDEYVPNAPNITIVQTGTTREGNRNVVEGYVIDPMPHHSFQRAIEDAVASNALKATRLRAVDEMGFDPEEFIAWAVSRGCFPEFVYGSWHIRRRQQLRHSHRLERVPVATSPKEGEATDAGVPEALVARQDRRLLAFRKLGGVLAQQEGEWRVANKSGALKSLAESEGRDRISPWDIKGIRSDLIQASEREKQQIREGAQPPSWSSGLGQR